MKRSRLLLASLIGLTALSGASFASSLAWYNNATNLAVRTLEIEMAGEKGLKIGTTEDVAKMKDKLAAEELDQVVRFAPVSTMFESRWRDGKTAPKFYEYANLITSDKGIPFGPDAVSYGHYSQTLWLCADDNVYVGIDPAFCFVRAYVEANMITARNMLSTYTYEERVERLNTLEKAIRVSIYDFEDDNYVIIDPHREGITYYGGVLDNDRDGFYDIYMEGGTGFQKEILYGEYNDYDAIVHGERLEVATEADGELTSFNAGHSYGTHPFDLEASTKKGLVIKQETAYTFDELGSNDIQVNPFYVACHRNQPKPLQISIYLEGWDHDCVNANMGGSFQANLQFKILREMEI
ncbi:MAG: hypothetical protein IJU64_06610 [Bacilli bacterium]|nr:hypothetical protein [Bacilli bacterium]